MIYSRCNIFMNCMSCMSDMGIAWDTTNELYQLYQWYQMYQLYYSSGMCGMSCMSCIGGMSGMSCVSCINCMSCTNCKAPTLNRQSHRKIQTSHMNLSSYDTYSSLPQLSPKCVSTLCGHHSWAHASTLPLPSRCQDGVYTDWKHSLASELPNQGAYQVNMIRTYIIPICLIELYFVRTVVTCKSGSSTLTGRPFQTNDTVWKMAPSVPAEVTNVPVL